MPTTTNPPAGERHWRPAAPSVVPVPLRLIHLDPTTIPTVGPSDRFDLIWTFALEPAIGRNVFGRVPQQLLAGDTDTVI
jgi:hypothetical protein